MKLPKISLSALMLTSLLTGCQFPITVFPPPYLCTPLEISTYEVKGLTFVTTVTFSGLFAENLVREYAEKHHYRYYVVTMRSNGFKNRAERVSAMIYR